MNVNMHKQAAKIWSLGLVRAHGSRPAERCVALLEQKLSMFGLGLKESIEVICTNGASVVTKVGKLFATEQ
jgi:hypothetical protein